MKFIFRITLCLTLFFSTSSFAEGPQTTNAGVCTDCEEPLMPSAFSREQKGLAQLKSAVQGLVISVAAQKQIQSLQEKGFVCDKNFNEKDRAIECVGRLGAYKNKTHIYIPKDFSPEREQAQMQFFLHGFKSNQTFSKNKNDLDGVGDFAGMLEKSKNRKSILVVPESDGQCADYEIFIQRPETLLSMREEIESSTRLKYSQLTIAGHSGAYRAVNGVLKSKDVATQINKIGLFDSIYDTKTNMAYLREWLALNPMNKLTVAYVTGAQQSTEKQTLTFLEKASAYKEQIEIKRLDSAAVEAHMHAIQNGDYSKFLK